MNIILIGMRGSGKTSVGTLLAEKLDRQFIETDKLIEKKVRKNINSLVKEKGWKYFRLIETRVIKDIICQNNAVIATGGGVIINPYNINRLQKSGLIFWLKAGLPTLVKRISAGQNRPFLTAAKTVRDDLKSVLNSRLKKYEKASHFQINTDDKKINEIVDRIIIIINKYLN